MIHTICRCDGVLCAACAQKLAAGILSTDAEPRGYDPYNSLDTVIPVQREFRRDHHAAIRILTRQAG